MSTDLCTSKLLKGLYGVRPTMKILPTQPMINFSMEEIDMTVSEHSCCSGGGYGTDAKEATYLRTLHQYLGFAQDDQTPVYKDDRIWYDFVPRKSTFVPRCTLLFLHCPLLSLARRTVRTYV